MAKEWEAAVEKKGVSMLEGEIVPEWNRKQEFEKCMANKGLTDAFFGCVAIKGLSGANFGCMANKGLSEKSGKVARTIGATKRVKSVGLFSWVPR